MNFLNQIYWRNGQAITEIKKFQIAVKLGAGDTIDDI